MAEYAKIDLYGLLRDTNWQGLFCNDLILKALHYNDKFNILTTHEISCLNSAITGSNYISCGC